MPTFTLQDLRHVMTSASGDIDGLKELTNANLDAEFAELGYDSLALLELVSQIQRGYGVPMPDDATDHMTTPRLAMGFINERFRREVAGH